MAHAQSTITRCGAILRSRPPMVHYVTATGNRLDPTDIDILVMAVRTRAIAAADNNRGKF
jgi:hypothetical protein